MKILVGFRVFSKKCHVSFKVVSSSFMYLILSPVSAQARAGLWQIQWKFGITLLILLNRAATPLYFPAVMLAPSLTTDYRFLTSTSRSLGDQDLTSDDLSICTLAGIYTLGCQEFCFSLTYFWVIYLMKLINCSKTATSAASSAGIPKLLVPSNSLKHYFLNALSKSDKHFNYVQMAWIYAEGTSAHLLQEF